MSCYGDPDSKADSPGRLSRHTGDRRVLSNKEVEVAIREWLQMQGADFNDEETFELALRWDNASVC